MHRHRDSPGRMLARVAAVLAAVAAVGAPLADGDSASGRAASAPLCMTPGLVVWLDTTSNGTAGSIYYALEFTNLSGSSCTLDGFPYVWALSLGGARLGSPASFDHSHPANAVTLAHGATASAVLRIVEAGNFPASSCHEATAAALRVYPPNQTRDKTVPFPFSACSRRGPVYLSVGAVQRR